MPTSSESRSKRSSGVGSFAKDMRGGEVILVFSVDVVKLRGCHKLTGSKA